VIDLQSENVLSLTDAAAMLPRRRAGRKPHISTLYRWAQRGVRGVRLEILKVGATTCTSTEALQRFCERLTGGENVGIVRTSKQRQKRLAKVQQELAAIGI
jgi:hypothetical protein